MLKGEVNLLFESFRVNCRLLGALVFRRIQLRASLIFFAGQTYFQLARFVGRDELPERLARGDVKEKQILIFAADGQNFSVRTKSNRVVSRKTDLKFTNRLSFTDIPEQDIATHVRSRKM